MLLVEPTYKSYWDIPGATSSRASRRSRMHEVREELGIEPPIRPLLVVDWAPAESEGDKIVFTDQSLHKVRKKAATVAGRSSNILDSCSKKH